MVLRHETRGINRIDAPSLVLGADVWQQQQIEIFLVLVMVSIHNGIMHLKYKYLLSSTTGAPITYIPTCRVVELGGAAKRQRVTETKGVALLCYV